MAKCMGHQDFWHQIEKGEGLKSEDQTLLYQSLLYTPYTWSNISISQKTRRGILTVRIPDLHHIH